MTRTPLRYVILAITVLVVLTGILIALTNVVAFIWENFGETIVLCIVAFYAFRIITRKHRT